jgi:hypothetical protein
MVAVSLKMLFWKLTISMATRTSIMSEFLTQEFWKTYSAAIVEIVIFICGMCGTVIVYLRSTRQHVINILSFPLLLPQYLLSSIDDTA